MPETIDSTALHSVILADGFVRLDAVISRSELSVMRAEVEELLRGESQPWVEYASYARAGYWRPLLLGESGRNTNLLDFFGESEQLDQLIDELLGRPDLRTLLTRILGPGYRIWYAQIRRAEVDAAPLRIHQDRPGEVGLGILLEDTDSAQGTTVFLKRSHLWPRLLNSFPFLSPRVLSRFLSGAVGAAGDAYLFYNCTWHGVSTATRAPRTAIIVTFLPGDLRPQERRPPPELVARLGPHLRQLLVGGEGPPNAIDVVATVEPGPDAVVEERRSIHWLSPWRIPMMAAAVCDRTIAVYRRFRQR